ncbi:MULTISPECIES: M56 family metallopeptidase [Mycolicibacterium]|jgi:Zn-dependent protease with chaperone function|uniref:Peptidase M48 n=2 Tax=Mycolicibacterium TaxID=1866885 RepID=A0A1X1TGC2_9MYCO|nr:MULTISPECIES: M56 family metallopeptidase [Mycolicibacterium]MCV7270160.1 M56 family metallopeptidase [Mycolicibacterium doricum]MDA4102685.1 peptidase M48 [Mycolicibacterium monacense DSM 44395]OBB74388.1 peptidase M48 [Mycolicibacterium monacense]OBF53992.1 peptidase M48 [Mycolicibacterium monacense]ORB16412.1 peptidase M48 [Mycolicibacterium monacense DSM 44395]
MTVAAALLLYVVGVLAIGPKLLTHITADAGAPRLAIAAWTTAVLTVIACSIAAIAMLLIEAAGHWDSPDALLVSCLERLRAILVGHAGWPARIVATVALAIAAGSLVAVAMRLGRALRSMRTHTFAHADAVRLVGRSYGNDVVVIDASEAAAYCVAGRPPAIVVTTAALAALDQTQLAAVVAHERAHLDGRHAYVVAAARGLTAALPRCGLVASAASQISSLLEMCADDAAARRHGRQPLLAGLLTLSGAATPAHGMAAANIAVLARAERLSDPPRRFARIQSQITLSGAVAAMAATPLAIVTLSLSGVLICIA